MDRGWVVCYQYPTISPVPYSSSQFSMHTLLLSSQFLSSHISWVSLSYPFITYCRLFRFINVPSIRSTNWSRFYQRKGVLFIYFFFVSGLNPFVNLRLLHLNFILLRSWYWSRLLERFIIINYKNLSYMKVQTYTFGLYNSEHDSFFQMCVTCYVGKQLCFGRSIKIFVKTSPIGVLGISNHVW